MDLRKPVVAIVVAGSTAPGVNGVISAVTIQATKQNCRVVGIFEGFAGLKTGHAKVKNLELEHVTRIQNTAGSILQTSTSQLQNDSEVDNTLRVLQHHRVRYLVCIGGAHTSSSAYLVSTGARRCNYALSVALVPKSIFNDLTLPSMAQSFGYATACQVGSEVVQRLHNDARTMNKWYIVTMIGQQAGHLALEVGKAAAATITAIPEDFQGRKVTFLALVDMIEASIYTRQTMNKGYGIAVLSEGLVNLMSEEEVQSRFGSVDEGHRQLSSAVAKELETRLKDSCPVDFITTFVGHECRAADPIGADINLSRDLGFVAVQYVLRGGRDAIVTLQGDEPVALPLNDAEFMDVRTQKARTRFVDTSKTAYNVAQSYMLKLTHKDLTNPAQLAKLCAVSNMGKEQFVKRFSAIAVQTSGRS